MFKVILKELRVQAVSRIRKELWKNLVIHVTDVTAKTLELDNIMEEEFGRMIMDVNE